MNRHSVILRNAKPVFDEGLVFTRYLDEAAEGFISFLFGPRAAEIVAYAYTQPDNDYSFQNVTFAEQNDVIVGMVLGYPAEQRLHFSDQPVENAPGFPALRVKTIKILLAPIFRILKTMSDGDFYVLAIAIDEEHRGKGVGSVLMDFIEKRAHECGSTRLSLDVSAKNEGARRLYERRGMIVESQWPKRLPLHALRFYRMTKTL